MLHIVVGKKPICDRVIYREAILLFVLRQPGQERIQVRAAGDCVEAPAAPEREDVALFYSPIISVQRDNKFGLLAIAAAR